MLEKGEKGFATNVDSDYKEYGKVVNVSSSKTKRTKGRLLFSTYYNQNHVTEIGI